MKILLVGSGGREHALAWKIKASRLCDRLYIAPGNPGMEALGELVPIAAGAITELAHFAATQKIDFAVIGPEDPLALGLVDALAEKKIRAFGPTRSGAQLEADKTFAKKLMREARIPTAEGRCFSAVRDALAYVESRTEPLVVKAAGLARGKGVVVCRDPVAALDAVRNIMEKKVFGPAGAAVVIEERLEGPEVSLLALVDGQTAYLLEAARDHKRIGEHDTGPNTGGMGAYSCPDLLAEDLLKRAESEIMVPLLDALRRQEIDYRGVLYAGLMLTAGGPKTLEFNCRLGDPETQPLLMRLQSDLVEAMLACSEGKLDRITLQWRPEAAVCVVLASEGYGWKADPEVTRGVPIDGLEAAAALPDVQIFHGGTTRREGRIVTSGGRVLGVCAVGADVAAARRRAYAAVDQIHFAGMQFRRDIAQI